MPKIRKSDRRLALGLAIVVTALGAYSGRFDILLYPMAVSCAIIGLSWFFDDEKEASEISQIEKGRTSIFLRGREKYAILLSLLLSSAGFFYLGSLTHEQISAAYRLAMSAVMIIVAPFFLFGVFFGAIVLARSCWSNRRR